jgi:hypothetical protein
MHLFCGHCGIDHVEDHINIFAIIPTLGDSDADIGLVPVIAMHHAQSQLGTPSRARRSTQPLGGTSCPRSSPIGYLFVAIFR